MRTLKNSTPAIAILAGLTLTGALTGCTTAAGTDTGAETDTGTDTPTTSGDYADGTYTETGEYQAPSGTETVEVTLTLADGVITAVEVVGDAADPQAKLHQGQFINGIGAVVEGRSIDEIQVDKVGGSSLTSGGFNRAVEAIKADAAA
jgi:uncharacterized protein with FMN-binding domain